MAEDTIEELQQRLKVHDANARASVFKARVGEAQAGAAAQKANRPSMGEILLGEAGGDARAALRGATGVLDLPAAAVTGLHNIPDTFWNAAHPNLPQRPTPTPQEYFGSPGAPAMQPTDLFNQLVPPVAGHEHPLLELPSEVGGALLTGGGFRGIASGGRAGARAAAREGAVLPTLAAAPEVTPGVLPAVGRGARTVGQALARAGIRTGVTTAGMAAGQQVGGALGRSVAEALGGPQYGDLGEHYGSQAGAVAGPAGLDALRVPFYNAMNYAYAKPGDVNVPGSSAHTLQAMADLGQTTDLGHVGNVQAANLLDFTAGLPMAGRPAFQSREQLYRGLEQAVTDAAANKRVEATGGVGPIAPGTGRNITEVGIGGQAIQAGRAAAGNPDRVTGMPSRGIHAALETVYDDPRTGLHRNDPATGQPILGRDDPIAVQTEHQVYNDILNAPETAQAPAVPQVGRLQRELTQSSNLIVDPAREAQIDAGITALRAQRASYAPGSPTLARIDQDIATLEASRQANRGPSFQAQRDLRALGPIREGVSVLDERTGDQSYAAKTATMRQAAEDRGLGGVFDTAETEASRLLRQRDALSGLTKDNQTAQAGFNEVFSKSGAGDLEQLGALLEHAPAETGLTFADQLELAGRGPAAAGTTDMNPAAFQPEKIVQLWDKASNEMKDAYARPGTPLRQHLEATVAAARADTLRSAARTKPGRGSNTLGGPQRYFQNPALLAGLGAGAGALAFGIPGLGPVLAAAPSAIARLFGSRFTNPNFVQNVVHPPTLRGSLDLSRLLAAAVGNNSDIPAGGEPTLLPGTNNVILPSPQKQAVSAARQKAIDLARSPLKTLNVPGF